jgi:hypothetical protein
MIKKNITIDKIEFKNHLDFIQKPLVSIYKNTYTWFKLQFTSPRAISKSEITQTAWLIKDNYIFTTDKILLPLKIVFLHYPEGDKEFKEHLQEVNSFLSGNNKNVNLKFTEDINIGSDSLSSGYQKQVNNLFYSSKKSTDWVNVFETLNDSYLKDMEEILSIGAKNNSKYVYSTSLIILSIDKNKKLKLIENDKKEIERAKNNLMDNRHLFLTEELTSEELEEHAISIFNQLN